MAATKTTKPKAKTLRRWRRGVKRLTATEVIELLGPSYGPFEHARKLEPVEELIFAILSQNTSDTNSERAFAKLIDAFGDLTAVAEADVEAIEAAISIGGLSKVKAPRIKRTLRLILEKRGDLDLRFLADLPLDEAKAWLTAIPGIGPKSAAVTLCFSLGMPAMAVDTHVHRVARRLGLIGPKVTAEKAHELLEPMTPPEDVYAFHTALITHGRKTCKAQRPLCGECALASRCPNSLV